MCLEVDGRIIVIDCGLMFPETDMPGIDLVLPDFTFLRDHADQVDGIVVTHGHEDHVGGLAYLLRDVSAPIYGSPLSLGLARHPIPDARLLHRPARRPADRGARRPRPPRPCLRPLDAAERPPPRREGPPPAPRGPHHRRTPPPPPPPGGGALLPHPPPRRPRRRPRPHAQPRTQ